MANYKTCCCCCKIKLGIKIIHGFDLAFMVLFIIYTAVAAASLDSTIDILKEGIDSSDWDSTSTIGSFDDFLKAFEATAGAFVIIPALIIDIIFLPRIFTYFIMSKDWKCEKKRRMFSRTRTVTYFMLLAIYLAGMIVEGIYIGTGNLIMIVFASPLLVLFILEFLGVIAFDTYLVVVAHRYYKKRVDPSHVKSHHPK